MKQLTDKELEKMTSEQLVQVILDSANTVINDPSTTAKDAKEMGAILDKTAELTKEK